MWAGVGRGLPDLDESLEPARLPMEVVVGTIGVIWSGFPYRKAETVLVCLPLLLSETKKHEREGRLN